MAKIRIFQIAKELNISHTDIVSFLKSKKVQVSSHMSPVEENIRKMIMDEFAKDKEQVDRFRKEKVRREIHDTRLKEQQQSTKKLKLLSLNEQRRLEQKEIERKANEEKEKKIKLVKESLEKYDEVAQRVKEYEDKKKKCKASTESKKKPNTKAKELKKKFKSSKKLRSINLSDIQTKIGAGSNKQPSAKQKKIQESAQQSVKTKVKGILAKMDTKSKQNDTTDTKQQKHIYHLLVIYIKNQSKGTLITGFEITL